MACTPEGDGKEEECILVMVLMFSKGGWSKLHNEELHNLSLPN
jgi:hypothetical protein